MSDNNDRDYLFMHLRRRGYKVSKGESLRALINIALMGMDEEERKKKALEAQVTNHKNEIMDLEEEIDNYPGPAYGQAGQL